MSHPKAKRPLAKRPVESAPADRPPPIEPLAVRPKKVAQALDVSERTVWDYIREGKLEVVRPSANITLITVRSMRRLVEPAE
jgi:hypothetical protein